MRTAILTVAILLVLCGVTKAEMTLWGMYDVDTAGVRVGYIAPESKIECGLFAAWRPDPEQPPNIFGAYSLYEFDAIDVNNPIPASWLPKVLTAKPYLGGYLTIDLADEQRIALGGPMAGLKICDVIALEYRYQLVNGPLSEDFTNGQSVFAICLPVKF